MTTKETILGVLKELVNEVAPNSDDTVSKKLGKFGWIEIDVQNQVGVRVDTDEFGRDVCGNVFTAHLSIGDKDCFDPEVDEEYECNDIIISDATVYNRGDMEEQYTAQTLVESGAVDLEEIAANFAKEVEYYRPRFEELTEKTI